jgi:membrane-associated phospholipid phosphatase
MKFEPTPLNIIAKIISGVVHPMLMPIFGSYLIFSMPSNLALRSEETVRLYLLGTVFICTCILPSIVIIVLKLMGAIQTISLNEKKDRRIHFIFTGICYTICYWAILKMQIPRGLFPYSLAYPLILGATLTIVLALVVNHWFKISIHMMGIGGVLGSFIAIALKYSLPLTPFIYILIVLAGLTGFARLQLNAHTPAQVYSGFTVSALCNSALILLL